VITIPSKKKTEENANDQVVEQAAESTSISKAASAKKTTAAKETSAAKKATAKADDAKAKEATPKPSRSRASKAKAVPPVVEPTEVEASQNGAVKRQIVFDSNSDRFTVAEQAIEDGTVLRQLVKNLAGADRRLRQFSAGAIAVVSERQPELLTPYIVDIVDALHRPEAQTRWECLEALSRVIALDPDAGVDAVSGAEASLYDEENGPARLGAIRFLAAYGALDAKRSSQVWPYIDEAIQVYHGDPEFQDMLVAVIGFASGSIAKPVRQALTERMRFDAENAKGVLQRRAAQIIELCKK